MKRMQKRLKIFIIAATVAVILTAALLLLRPFGSNIIIDEGIKNIIGVSVPDLSDPWQFELYKDINLEAKNYKNVNIVFNDAALSIEKQKQDIDNFVKQKVDIMIVMAVDQKAVEDKLRDVIKSEIPVIVLQRPLNCEYASFIYSDNYKIGQTAAEYAKKVLGEKGGTVLEIQGDPYSYETMQRKAGFIDTIKNTAIKKEYVLAGYWSRDTAYERLLADDIFSKNPQIDLIFAHNDTMGIGAFMAAKERGRSYKIIGVGYLPGNNLGREAVLDGILSASVEYLTGGAEAIATAMKILNGQEVPKNQEISVSVVTR